jgi:hypothetical protein
MDAERLRQAVEDQKAQTARLAIAGLVFPLLVAIAKALSCRVQKRRGF